MPLQSRARERERGISPVDNRMAVAGRDIGREMLLEYEWGNSAAAAAAMLLFGEDSVQETVVQERQPFEHYAHCTGAADFFTPQPVPQQLSAAALFSASPSCHQRYELPLPPATPALGRIGLNLGVRTYFSSASPEEVMGLGTVGRVSRRRGRIARCQAEGCGADLTNAKHYHRRHKVCEFHSKASIVIAAGLSQRFCQQCSRFHVLSEFDQGKRSCRKRLADHNRRRRKSQDLSMDTTTDNSQNTDNNDSSTTTNPNPEKLLLTTSTSNNNSRMGCKLEPSSTVTHLPSPPQSQTPAPQMALGLGCFSQASQDVGGAVMVVPASTGLSASSSTGTSPPSSSFLSHLGDLRTHEHRFPGWD